MIIDSFKYLYRCKLIQNIVFNISRNTFVTAIKGQSPINWLGLLLAIYFKRIYLTVTLRYLMKHNGCILSIINRCEHFYIFKLLFVVVFFATSGWFVHKGRIGCLWQTLTPNLKLAIILKWRIKIGWNLITYEIRRILEWLLERKSVGLQT